MPEKRSSVVVEARRRSEAPADPSGRDASTGPRNKGGRPKGSVSLTREIEEKILAIIRAGGWGYAAAEAAGISARCYYEWIARGEGRSARGSTPKLVAFAKEVRKAEAGSRVLAEAEVYRTRPALWLSRRVRSKPGREGWTAPVEGSDRPSFSLDFHDYQDPAVRTELFRVHELMLQIEPDLVIPPCPDGACACAWHRPRSRPSPRGGGGP
ncbi:MAG: hypothetical protein E6G58_01150 [Actinobacteria bacterium]|nr:MAG: hypothetical protein E6G58_01150 [Actinomycetota bacterium]